MYFIKIRESVMIAHSLKNGYFGPAQNLHGATYIVDVSFKTKILNEFNVVLDLDLAHKIILKVLNEINYSNLDDLPDFNNTFSTTEVVAKFIHDKIKIELDNFDGFIIVEIQEKHNAWAGYTND